MLTKHDLHAIGKLIDNRLQSIEGKLAKTASKDDLKPFVTRADLSNFATKDDLKLFATKDELISSEKRLTLLIKKSVRKLQREIKITGLALDTDVINLKKQMDRVENHLNLPPFTG